MKQCVILAGGRGTRLGPLTDTRPKALIEVAGHPFVHHQLAWLARNRVRSVVLSIGYLGEMIRSYVGDGSAWDLSVRYVDDGEEQRGTAGALRLAADCGALDETFFVLYGDAYLPVELEPVEEAFTRRCFPALMTVHRNENRWVPSNVTYEQGRIVLYDKDRPTSASASMRHIDYGLSVVTQSLIVDRVPPSTLVDLAWLYRELSREGLLAGFEVAVRFFEIGSFGGLAELESHLRRPDP